MNVSKVEVPFGNQTLILETGKLARQANAAVTVTLGGTTVLVAVCMSKEAKEGADFFPLVVEYQEKTYAAGRIPGGFFKREGKPTQKEVLTSRLIDRPIRPLFPEGMYYDVVVTCTVLSSDGENDPDILAVVGASAALHISDIPYEGPIGCVRIGSVDGQWIVNPTYAQRETSNMDLVVVGLADGIVMIEGESDQIEEAKVVEALQLAFDQLQSVRLIQDEFRKKAGKPKTQIDLYRPHPELKNKVAQLAENRLADVYQIADKLERENALNKLLKEIQSDLTVFDAYKVDDQEISPGHIKAMFDMIEYDHVRKMIFEKGIRADGRGTKDIRAISCEVNVLPRTHGSSLFTRGQTQSLATVTLGTRRDEQMIESLSGESYNNFMLHYNFPAFSVGEAKQSRGPGRREIGHGALAGKALKAVLPSKEDFPYTTRVVSEILESNGSSSMASVCAGCLSLMAAGVPIKDAVAGISIGLVTDKDRYKLLTDIMGLEDHFGDMDFKVAGTRKGVTAIQLDLKIKGVPLKVLAEGISQATDARFKILDKMQEVIAKPNPEISQYAPRILSMMVPQDKIGEVIGPGGKMIKRIIEETGVESIDIDDDGKVIIASFSKEAADKALKFVRGFTEAPEVGKIYDAKVVRVMNFGAFCEFLPGREGLVHVSEFSQEYVKDINTVVKIGDRFKVKLVEIDQMKRVNLSKKQADAELGLAK